MTRIAITQLAQEILARLQVTPRLPIPAARALRRAYSKRLAHVEAKHMLMLAEVLLKSPASLARFMAYELIYCHRDATKSLRARDLERLGRGLDSWGAVDTFACYLSGPAWRAKQVTDALISKWARSQDRWLRRAALVSTVPLNRKAPGDARRTLRLCRMLMQDRDDMVVKALSWALRELSKRDANAVRAFLSQYESELAPRVLREVRNKFKTGLKNPKGRG